jgi:non-heme chloroperoxidase
MNSPSSASLRLESPEVRPFDEPLSNRMHTLRGGGGVTLRVRDLGDPEGPPLLFLHGFSQSHQAWRRQLHSALGLGFRLVALDLRGHGESDSPRGAYADGRLWADDVQAVIAELGLGRALLVAWSYGGLVVADYLRHYGQRHVAGVNFVGAMVKSGSEEAFGLLAPELLDLIPGLFSADERPSLTALESFVSLLHHEPLAPEVRRAVMAYTARVPAHVREGLGARTVDNDDVLRELHVPVLVSHGLKDRVVLPASGQHIASLVPHAQVSHYSDVGHSPFWESARRFNRELAAFAAKCW